MTRIQILLKVIPRLVGLLFVYAAISKLIYPTQATAALESLGFQYVWADAMVFGTIMLELYLGLILLLHIDLQWGLSASMGVMFLFAVFLWYLSMTTKPPSCGCLGLTTIFTSAKHEALFGLFRNCAILWALKLSYDYYFRPPKPAEMDAA